MKKLQNSSATVREASLAGISARNAIFFAAIGAATGLMAASATQAAIVRGDVAIVRMNNGGSPDDNFSVVALKDLSASDSLFWTDEGWLNTQAFRGTGEGPGTTDIVTTNITAGTVFNVPATGIANSGDQLFLFTGTKASPTLLYGVDWGNAAGWDANATTSNNSALPTQLTGTANGTAYDYAMSLGTAASYTYTGTLTGTPEQILAALALSSNWTAGTASNNAWTAGNFTITGSGGGTTPKNLTWNLSGGTWNTATANWTGDATTFTTGDNVTFADGKQGTVTIVAGGVSPGSTLVSNTTGTYTFQNAAGDTHGIMTGSLTKTGAGTLVLANQNTFNGGVSLNGGTLSVSNDNQLGDAAGTLTFGGGTLTTTAGITSARNITVNAGGGTYNTNGVNSSNSGTLSVSGAFVKAGSGDLLLTGVLNTNTGGTIGVAGGSLTMGQAAGTVNLNADATGTGYAGDLVLVNAIRANFNGGIFSGGGQIRVLTTLSSLANTGTSVSATIGNNIVLNANGAAQSFVTSLGSTSGNTLTVTGVISGDSDVNLAVGTSGGAGFLILNGASTYTGATTINCSTTGVIQLGTHNVLPTTTALSFGTNTGAGPGTLDLHGFNQQVASLSFGGQGLAANAKITNLGSADATLTVNGSTNPAAAFSGVISDGTTNKLSLVKDGSNTLNLTGVNTYSGATAVHNGVLKVGGSIANSDVTVDGTGVLELDSVNALGNLRSLTFADSATGILNFSGMEVVGTLTFGGVTYTSGVFDATRNPDFFSGSGAISVPEPTSMGLFGLAAIGLLARRRRVARV